MTTQKKIWGLILLVAVLAFALFVVRRMYSPTGEEPWGVSQLRRPTTGQKGGGVTALPPTESRPAAKPGKAIPSVDTDGGGDDTASSEAPSASAGVTLTPEVKQAIAEEIKAQLAAQQGAAAPPPTTATGAASDRPGQLRFEAGVRLWIRVSRISRKPDGNFTFGGTLLQPALAGHVELDQSTELAGYGIVNNGRVTVRVTGFTFREANYTLQGTSRSNRQPGTGPAVEITPGKLLEVWFASASVYQKTP
jgi:hypothetical protein